MATVDPGYASWLKVAVRNAGATIVGALATWGDKALDSATTSALAYQPDAQAEAARQAQFLAGPIVRDKVVVNGLRHDLIGCSITITGDRAGYENGANVFVIGAEEAPSGAGRTTTLTVLKRL